MKLWVGTWNVSCKDIYFLRGEYFEYFSMYEFRGKLKRELIFSEYRVFFFL